MSNFADTIARDGSAPWLITPWNFFGAYELSYPAGYPILLGEVAQMANLSVETVILLCSFACGIFAALTSFVLALEIRRDPLFAFFISLAYTTAPLLLFITTWSASTRSIFLSLLPLTIWLLIKFERLRGIESERGARSGIAVLLFLDLIIMISLHRLAFMLALFFFAYFIWRAIDSRWLVNRSLRIAGKRGPAFRATIVGIFAVCLAIPILYASYTSGLFNFGSYESGLIQGDSEVVKIVNLVAAVGMTIGYPLALTFPLALLFLLKDRKFDFLTLFFILSLLLLLPFAGGRIYDRMIYPIILLPLIMIPIVGRAWPKLRKNYRKAVAVAIVITLPLNLYFVNDHYADWSTKMIVDDGNSVSDLSYSTGLFAEYYLQGSDFVGNNWIMNMRFQSISGCFETLIALGPTDATNMLLSGLLNKTQLSYQLNDLSGILGTQGSLFTTYWKFKPQSDWVRLMLSAQSVESGSSLLKLYNLTFMLEDARIPGQVTGWLSSRVYPDGDNQSMFMTSVHLTMYKMYDNGREYIWLLPV